MKKSRSIPGKFLAVLRQALESIPDAVFYRDERGFQGAVLHELSMRLGQGVLPEDPIIQQEYQKRLRHHGIKIRPDIILHVPFERGLAEGRDEGNFVAVELKRRATGKRAKDAFANLALMKKALNYPLTVFTNVDSEQTHAALCPKSIADQTACFAVRLEDGKPVVRTDMGDRSAEKKTGKD